MHFLLILFSLFFITACQQPVQEDTAQHLESLEAHGIVIARVGNTPFYESDIDTAFTLLPENIQGLRDDLDARSQVLHTIIRRHILKQQAIKTKLDQNKHLLYRIQEAKNDILIEAVQAKEQKRIKDPSKNDIAKYFLKNHADYVIPAQIHIRHIIVATRGEALEIIDKIKKGSDFSELASNLSLDENSKVRGGDLNWLSRGVMDQVFEDDVFSLKEEGEISKEFQTQFGWHVAQLIAKKEKKQKTLEESSDEIKIQLKHLALQKWLNQLVSDSHVQILRTEYGLRTKIKTADSDS